MFRSKDLREMFHLPAQDLQYLNIGGFIRAAGTLSELRGSRRLYDQRNAFEVGVLSALRGYRVDFRQGAVLLQAIEAVLANIEAEEPQGSLFRILSSYRPFEAAEEAPLADYYLDLKDRRWCGIHFKPPKNRSPVFMNHAYRLELKKEGLHRDIYHLERHPIEDEEGERFWTTYDDMVSINLCAITRKINGYVKDHPHCKEE